MISFLIGHQRGQNNQLCFLWKPQDGVHHLIDGLGADGESAFPAVRDTDSCEKEPEIVINFCNGPHSGARVVAGGLLFNGNGRR